MGDISRAQSIAREQFMHVKTQAAFGTGVIPGSSAGKAAMKILGGGITDINASEIRADSQSGLDPTEIIRGPDGPHTATISKYLNPAGTSVAMDDDELLQNLYEQESRAAVTIITATSKTKFTVLDMGTLEAGDIIWIPVKEGSSIVEMAVVDSAADVSGVDTITLKWALTRMLGTDGYPEDDTIIPACKQWFTRNVLKATKYFSLLHSFGGQSRYLNSAVVTGLTTTVDQSADGVRLAYDITGQHFSVVGQAELGALLSATATTATVTAATASMIAGANSDNPVYINMQSEVLKVIEISGTTITFPDDDTPGTRDAQESTTPAIHAEGTAITPWSGDTETVGNPIPNVYGAARLEGVEYEIVDAEFADVEPIEARLAWGNEEADSFLKSAGLREASLKMTLLGKADDWAMTGIAVERDSFEISLQIGKVAGYCWGIHLPAVKITNPVPSEGVDGAITIVMESLAILDSSGDEAAITQGSLGG